MLSLKNAPTTKPATPPKGLQIRGKKMAQVS
jgi:hypothetical protein